jgi:hypothetical protein
LKRKELYSSICTRCCSSSLLLSLSLELTRGKTRRGTTNNNKLLICWNSKTGKWHYFSKVLCVRVLYSQRQISSTFFWTSSDDDDDDDECSIVVGSCGALCLRIILCPLRHLSCRLLLCVLSTTKRKTIIAAVVVMYIACLFIVEGPSSIITILHYYFQESWHRCPCRLSSLHARTQDVD